MAYLTVKHKETCDHCKREPQAESPSISNTETIFDHIQTLKVPSFTSHFYRYMQLNCLKFNLIWVLSSYNILCYSFAQASLTILFFLSNEVFPFCISFVFLNLTD